MATPATRSKPRHDAQAPARSRGRPSARDERPYANRCSMPRDDCSCARLCRRLASARSRRRPARPPAMIHYYFGDKLGLYRAMIEAASGAFRCGARSSDAQSGADTRGRHRRAHASLHADARRQSMGAAADRPGGAGRRRALPRAVHRAVRGPARADARRGAAPRAGAGQVASRCRSAACSGIRDQPLRLSICLVARDEPRARTLGRGRIARASRRAHGALFLEALGPPGGRTE